MNPDGQRRDDDKSLEPHSDVDAHRDRKHGPDVGADALEPVKLRCNDIAENHHEIGPRVRARAFGFETQTTRS